MTSQTSLKKRSERGFLLAGPVLYAAIAAGVIILGLTLALKVQSARLGAAKASLEACETRYKDALTLIERQNEGVKALKDASDKARRLATEAQASAKVANQGLAKERERLAAASKVVPLGPCPAGEGVRIVREGLK